jgi:UDP-glucose 4-epimerase
MVKAFSKESGAEVPYKIVERRAGDIAECYADSTKAKEMLGWVATHTLEDMCGDSWRWQKGNPNGYND